MRYFLALTSLVLGIMLLIFGAIQRTVLASQHDMKLTSTISASAYTLIEGSEIAKIPGRQHFNFGRLQATVVVGSKTDIAAWIENLEVATLVIDENKQLVAGPPHMPQNLESTDLQEVTADSEATFDAEGASEDATPQLTPESPESVHFSDSDLWVQAAFNIDGRDFKINTNVTADQAILIKQHPEYVTEMPFQINWHEKFNTPWAGPLLTVGGVFAFAGAVLYVLFVDRDRRGLGPQRGKRGPLVGLRGVLRRKEQVNPVYASKTPAQETAAVPAGAAKEANVTVADTTANLTADSVVSEPEYTSASGGITDSIAAETEER